MATYNSRNVRVTLNGTRITGFRDGDIYAYSVDEDARTYYKGADGRVDFSEKPTNECTITIGLKHNSPSRSYIENLDDLGTELDMVVRDNNDNGQVISANGGVLMRRPDETRGKAISEVEYVFMFADHSKRQL